MLRYFVLAAMLVPLLALARVRTGLWLPVILSAVGIIIGHWYSYKTANAPKQWVRLVMFIAIHLALIWLVREVRFHEHAYLFVLAALEFQQSRLPERRHINGRELSSAVRDLAIERFGVMARLVLEHWGVTTTNDVGDIVFTMVELGLLMSQPSDNRADFADVFAFDTAFEVSYPWSAAHLSGA
jgi:uncharacterized repeat protein (TIGR04138 family)